MKIVYLKPLGGYATPLRSDTLWGMLCWGMRYLYGESALTAFVEQCRAGNPPLIITSTFPAKLYGTTWLPFFPNPLPFPNVPDTDVNTAMDNARLRKVYKKKWAYLNAADFRSMLEGQLKAEHLCQRLGQRVDINNPAEAEILESAPLLEDFSMTHNTIDRRRGGTLNLLDPVTKETAGQLFHSPEHYWSDPFADVNQPPNTGIFFLADGPEVDRLEPILRLFRHWGFGADRTSGKGFFDFEVQDFALPRPASANAMMNLSLLHPTREELQALDALKSQPSLFRYQIELRQGYANADYALPPKKAHRYFREGSILPLLPGLNGRHLGRLIQQHDKPHPIWDNGFGFMLPLNWS